MPRGFDTREAAVDAAREHIRTQFARIGVDDVEIEIEEEIAGESGSSAE